MDSLDLERPVQELGVYELISRLCEKSSSKCCGHIHVTQKELQRKMRSHSYELLLKKSKTEIANTTSDAVSDLLAYYFVLQQNNRNIIDFKRCSELKEVISNLRDTNLVKDPTIQKMLKFLLALKNSGENTSSSDRFPSPFTFGILDQMLPRLEREKYGSPQPYQYYPSYVFELPYSLNDRVRMTHGEESQMYPALDSYKVFESKSRLPNLQHCPGKNDLKSVLTPSFECWSYTSHSVYSSNVLDYPQLSAPRDLQIPTFETNTCKAKISVPDASNCKIDLKSGSKSNSIDIWEIASQIDKHLPDDIWEVVAKMSPVNERQLIATNAREVSLWRLQYNQMMPDIISEKIFIRHLMYLIIGVETNSFPYCDDTHCFYIKRNLLLEGISKEYIENYVSGLLLTGTYFKRLYNFAFNQSLDDHFHQNGLIYEAGREVVRRFLLKFRLKATEIFEESNKRISGDLNCMPTLLEILFHIEPLQYEMETVAAIFKMTNMDPQTAIPRGAELMSYLFNEISLVTHSAASYTLFNSLFSVCKVYFKFIERFIFEGELEDTYNEFFIRKDLQYINSHSKKYWDKGFHISQSVAVPEFLKVLAKCILLCGKSLRLLKLCNPSDPLVLLISTSHPTVKCCWNLEQLASQQQVLDVYRTRCLFVSGEPVSFKQILLKREAERKAFTEMASQKQAETLEKIVAERKRLAQLIIAEKQHSLRILEAAIAETKAAKKKSNRRERLKTELELDAEKAHEEVDSRFRDDERNKMLAYYSKLNMEVEKSKIHTEWKIKRLQLDEARMKLLSSEERNLKREKLELEHHQNEVKVSDFESTVNCGDEKSDIVLLSAIDYQSQENASVNDNERNIDGSKTVAKKKNSSEVFNLLYNAAKNIFGFKSDETVDNKNCDNKCRFDAQGNVVPDTNDSNTNIFQENNVSASSKTINKGNEAFCNAQFNVTRQEALINKEKGMSHVLLLTDIDNNQLETKLVQNNAVDAENNLSNNQIGSEFDEARKNKIKVLGSEFDNIDTEIKKNVYEPRTEAQKEALRNRKKILGVEYNLPVEASALKIPENEAQEEALINKERIMGVEYNIPMELSYKKLPANEAQEKAILNKERIMGVSYNIPMELSNKKMPANTAQEEAIINKERIMGVKYNIPMEQSNKKMPANEAQEEAIINKERIMGVEYNIPMQLFYKKMPANEAQEEAVINKERIMGVEYNIPMELSNRKMPANEAQEEAVINKERIMGVEYNIPMELSNRKMPANEAQEEAVINKERIMGVEYNIPMELSNRKMPANEAQEEAIINRERIMGVEYNIPMQLFYKKMPANEAQEEAVINKERIMGVEYNIPMELSNRKMPANEAQEEAIINRERIMGVEYNIPMELSSKKMPANEAQEEAIINKERIMGVEYNIPMELSNRKMPANEAQEEAIINRERIMGVEYNIPMELSSKKMPANEAQVEAIINKKRIMGVDYNTPKETSLKKIPANEAQEKALLNKQRMMGVEYGQTSDVIKREPANIAQEEGLRNRKKILESNINCIKVQPDKQSLAKRSGLTLNLKPVSESNINRSQFSITPNTGAVTPAEFFPRLDLETPTTAEAPLDGQVVSEPFSPQSERNKDLDSNVHGKSDGDYLSSKEFNFSTLMTDDEVDSGEVLDSQTNISADSSPTKTPLNIQKTIESISMKALWNTEHEYNFDDFDPFGMKDLEHYTADYFNNKMDLEMSNSCYTHPTVIMEELRKSPSTNIFEKYFTFKDDEDPQVACDNIAILTACLQRSVMLPLTYQLEVVNNSILTYFLVNLDLYEHLKSLKDYFFLMDGEFSSTICHNLFLKLNKTINPQELLNFATLHSILDKSLGSSITRVNKFSENLTFTITEPPLSFHQSSPDVLQCLSLTYEVSWPLNIILSQEALMRYSKVFQFLIKMRRISWILGQDFEELKFATKRSHNSRILQRSPQYISVQLYRYIMASLIRALDNYIVTTCILTSWTEFEDDLKKARTLDDLYEFHVVYIKKVLFRCLLNNRSTPVMKLLNDIFTVILKFSRVLRATSWQYSENSNIFTHANFAQLEELFHLFEKLAKYLHKVIMKLMECGYQRHLAELLSMVNLNSYYEPDKTNTEHNSNLRSTAV